MSNEYLLTYRKTISDKFEIERGTAYTAMTFLKSIDEEILKDNMWTVYQITSETEKRMYVHSGEIDEIIDEY